MMTYIMLKKGDQFHAKPTVTCMFENYPEQNDGIMDTTRRKLQVIEAGEAKDTKNQNKPLEINIGGEKK